MIYDKYFFTGLALVVGGVVAGGMVLSFSLGGAPNISFDASFSESSASGGDTIPCVVMTCKPGAKAKDCGYTIGVKGFGKHSTIAPKGGEIVFTGDLGKGEGSAARDFEDWGFDFRETTCNKSAVDTCKAYQLPILAAKYKNNVCTPNDSLEAKKQTPPPTPKPGAKIDYEKLFACTAYKCWRKAWTDPRLPLGTPDDPFFVDDTATMNLILVSADNGSAGFFQFLERRAKTGSAGSTKICFTIQNPPPPGHTTTICQSP